MTIHGMDFRKQIRRHPAHRAVLRRMRPRRDFFDTVAPLTDAEEREFAALQANMAMRVVMHQMQPLPLLPPHPHGAPLAGSHRHLPRFEARADQGQNTPKGWSPAVLTAMGLLAAGTLLATVCGLVLAF